MGSWGCDKAFKLKALSIMTCPARAAAFALASSPSTQACHWTQARARNFDAIVQLHVCGAEGFSHLFLTVTARGTCRQPMALGMAPLSGRQGWPRIKVEAKLRD
ncbi:hypothetical protein BKA80DRAFT_286316 [Phyllosticta citrichinensis]